MPATQTAHPINIHNLTCTELTKPAYIESGRTKWEARRAGDLIRMFAAGGFDVIKDTKDSGEEIEGSWRVLDQFGDFRASILSHHDVPDFAYAYTCAV